MVLFVLVMGLITGGWFIKLLAGIFIAVTIYGWFFAKPCEKTPTDPPTAG